MIIESGRRSRIRLSCISIVSEGHAGCIGPLPELSSGGRPCIDALRSIQCNVNMVARQGGTGRSDGADGKCRR